MNFAEYTSIVDDKHAISAFGEDTQYPRSTALLQTDDEARINIYNSFDSFVQHLVNISFKTNNSLITYQDTKYFNLNSDLGFLPQYANTSGNTRLCGNSALSGKNSYSIELLGPEDVVVPFTPVIIDIGNVKSGRVVEEYKEYDKLDAYNTTPIQIPAGINKQTYEFMLSNVFPSLDFINTFPAPFFTVSSNSSLQNINPFRVKSQRGILPGTTPGGISACVDMQPAHLTRRTEIRSSRPLWTTWRR